MELFINDKFVVSKVGLVEEINDNVVILDVGGSIYKVELNEAERAFVEDALLNHDYPLVPFDKENNKILLGEDSN